MGVMAALATPLRLDVQFSGPRYPVISVPGAGPVVVNDVVVVSRSPAASVAVSVIVYVPPLA